jgi:WhiB family transcriptional regulator, redox-sensing transcriptional regulator
VAQKAAAGSSVRRTFAVADWREAAACRHIDPELFFPVGTTGVATHRIEAAKRVCRSCEVIESCLEFALSTNQESGVWGGTSEDERRRLRKSWLMMRRLASPTTGDSAGHSPRPDTCQPKDAIEVGREAS